MWYEADAAQWDDVFATNVRGYFTGRRCWWTAAGCEADDDVLARATGLRELTAEMDAAGRPVPVVHARARRLGARASGAAVSAAVSVAVNQPA